MIGKHSSGYWDKEPEVVTSHKYWGNVCSGFGGSLNCFVCERHMFDHQEARHRADG